MDIPDDFGIELRSLAVKYPLFELEPLSVRLTAGERVALVGPNGAGKTTILRALSGSLPEYDGEVLFGGTETRSLLPALRNQVGLMPERLLGFEWMTVRQHFDLLAPGDAQAPDRCGHREPRQGPAEDRAVFDPYP
ncbi:MAG: ATP-binding cassette domain-containing protein [Gemmatimonadetes bacterium]|nr:ATP-binding cassette domain-containing protein [Gemmatimonadota bacterium]